MRAILHILFVFVIAVFSAPGARADVFTVSNVPIDGFGASVTEAQKTAIRAGTLEAAHVLVERLTLPADRADGGWLQMDADIAAQWVAGIQIRDEQRSNRRYLGLLQVTFDRARVRDFLNAQQLPFVEAQTANALVLPIWNGPDNTVLWAPNPWWQTWVQAHPEQDLSPLILPLADLGDRQAISADAAVQLNQEALTALAARYDVRKIVIALASENAPGQIEMRANIVSWDEANNIQVRQRRFSTNGNDHGTGHRARKFGLERSRAALVASLEREWKQLAIVRDNTITTLRLTASYTNIGGWRRIREVLATSPLVHEARLDAFSADGTLMTLVSVGTRQQLIAQLAQNGVELRDTNIGPVAIVR